MINRDAYFQVLRLLETPGIGVAKVREILDLPDRYNIKIDEFLSDRNAIKEYLKNEQFNAFISNEKITLNVWNRLLDKGVNFLIINDQDYPNLLKKRLGKKAPPFLSVMGNRELLNKPSVGFCGSRKASPKGIETAHDCAQQLASAGININSGYAAGIDMATHCAALEALGTTTIVLAEGILHFNIKKDIKDLFDFNKVVVISEVLPGIPWGVRYAMDRNKTICSLSKAMILIESGINGGSMAAGKTCLSLGIPLFAPVYEGMPPSAIGNQELLKQGAKPLLKSRKSNRANLYNIFEILKNTDDIFNNSVKKIKSPKLWDSQK